MSTIVNVMMKNMPWNFNEVFDNSKLKTVTDELLIWILPDTPHRICNTHHIDIWLNTLCEKLLILCHLVYSSLSSLNFIEECSFIILLKSKSFYSLRLNSIILTIYTTKHKINTAPLVLKFSTNVFWIIRL